MKRTLRDILLSVAIFGAGFAALVSLTDRLDAARPQAAAYDDAELLIEGGRLKGYLLGSDGLAADWYWARALQYIGDKLIRSGQGPNIKSLKPLDPRLLYPMLDQATTLDPQFMTVYSYGANLLPEIDPDQALKLIDKGIRYNPDEWRLYHYRGYVYWQLRDYTKAAESYEAGSKITGAPQWMTLMALNMRTRSSDRNTARTMYSEMLNSATDDQTREAMTLRLLNLDSLDERDAIREALRTFSEKTGRCAESWRELFPILRSVRLPNGQGLRVDRAGEPVDPTGAPYVLKSDKCEVRIDFQNSKLGIDYEELSDPGNL
jgi:tetratricopeptide (TPR) repeat protein